MIKIGISYDRPEDFEQLAQNPETRNAARHLGLTSGSLPPDRFAEFEPESTIEAMEAAIRHIGARPVRLGGPFQLLDKRPDTDLIWNIAEGYGTRNREAWVPVLCELYGIPCLGSDAYTLSWSLDKAAVKQTARELGIPTSDWQVFPSENHGPGRKFKSALPYPVFLKPRYEGTGKGISRDSIVHNEDELNQQLPKLFELYRQDVLAEAFLSGPEFTVALSGSPMKAHPVLERGIDAESGIGFHVLRDPADFRLSDSLTSALEQQLTAWSLNLCNERQVLDFARLDFKADAHGNPYFLEVNPLPTFATDNTFAILAEMQDVPYDVFLGEILRQAVGRVLSKSGKYSQTVKSGITTP